MAVKQEAAVFGAVVGIAGVAALLWLLRYVTDGWSLPAIFALCGAIALFCLWLAWRVDKKDAARKGREKSGPS